MPRQPLNPFEKAQKSHANVIARQPIGRTALLNSLQKLRETGGELVRDQEMGAVNYANTMHGILSTAVALETQPPLTDGQKAAIAGEMTGLEAITHANGDGETPSAPTDTNAIDTAKKKS